jgi:hypothetical protein
MPIFFVRETPGDLKDAWFLLWIASGEFHSDCNGGSDSTCFNKGDDPVEEDLVGVFIDVVDEMGEPCSNSDLVLCQAGSFMVKVPWFMVVMHSVGRER